MINIGKQAGTLAEITFLPTLITLDSRGLQDARPYKKNEAPPFQSSNKILRGLVPS